MPKQDAFVSLPTVFTGNSRPVQTAMLLHTDWAAAVVAKKPTVTESDGILALCREEAQEQGVGLRSEWRVTLAKVLSDVQAHPREASGGEVGVPAVPTNG